MRGQRARRGWRFSQALIAGLMIALAYPVAAEEQATPLPTPTISARGRVVTADGQPQPGCRVVLRASSTPAVVGLIDFPDVIAETTADEQGRFEFDRASIPARLNDTIDELQDWQRGADVVVTAEGFGISWVPLYSFDNPAEITVTLNPAAVLEGIVSDSAGRPVPGAQLTVLGISRFGAPFDGLLRGPDELRLYASSLRPQTATSDAGKFRIGQLPADCLIQLQVVDPDHQVKYAVTATSDRASVPALNLTLPGETREFTVLTNPIELRLEDGPRLRVRVFDEAASAFVRQGRIVLTRRSREWTAALRPDAAAGLTVAEPGYYRVIYLSGSDYTGFGMRQRVELTESANDSPQQVELRLPRTRWLAGRVVGQSTDIGLGQLSLRWESRSYFSQTETADDGGFRLPVTAGKGNLSIDGMARGFFIVSTQTMPYDDDEVDNRAIAVEVPEDGPAEPLTIEVPRGLSIRGTVGDSNGTIAPGGVAIASALSPYGPQHYESKVDDAGRFELAGLNPREDYAVSVTSQSGVAFQTVPGKKMHAVRVAREVQVDLTLEPMVTLRGRVLLGNEPVPNVALKLSRAYPVSEGSTKYITMARMTTGDDGAYALVGLKPGDRFYLAIRPPFPAVDLAWEEWQTLATDAQGEVELPDVQLSRLTQTLAGIVVDPDGNPVAGATVVAQRKDGDSLSSAQAGTTPWMKTTADGKFRFTQLPDQPLRLMAYIPPKPPDRRIRFPARVECQLNQQDIRILLDPALVEDE